MAESHPAIASRLLSKVKEYVAELELEEKRLDRAVKAADVHNNTDGVGIKFDYMNAPVGALARTRRALSDAHKLVAEAEEVLHASP